MISVVICTYNRAPSLGKTLDSLRQMAVPPHLKWELIVVNNNSTDNTREVVEQFARTSGLDVRYVFETAQGLCHARNTGVANARGEIIAFTDDDVLIAPEWLQELASAFREFDCIAVGGKITPLWDGIIKPDWFVTTGPYFLGFGPIPRFDHGDAAKQISSPPVGANMAFRKSAFEKYGLFRTDMDAGSLGPQLGGDYEFENRLLRGGEKVVYSPTAVVFHPAVQGRITKEYFLWFYYNLGRTDIRLEGWPSGAVFYFGVPRYMFRMLAGQSVTWLLTFGGRKRFYFKAQVYRSIGQIVEAHKLRREGQSAARSAHDVIACADRLDKISKETDGSA